MIRLILLTDFTEAYAHNLLRGILEYSKGREPWVVCRMPPSYKQANGIPGVLEWAKRWEADAIIGQFDDDDEVELFRQNGIIALAQDFKSRFTSIPNITGQYEETGRMAADFFLQKGFQNFAFYGYKDAVWSEERCIGFRNRVTEKGFGDNFFEYQKQPLDHLWYYESKPLVDWLKSLPRPLALMACDDTQGNKITELCRVLDIKIPEEIAVLGVDNDDILCDLSDPPLSSISHNIVQGGFEAAQLIDRLLHDEDAEMTDVVIQPITVINRLSTDIYATDNPVVLAALKYIHQNLTSKIGVDDIVKRVPLSRRLLEIRFKEVTGQTIYQYMFHLRMEHFSQLLLASTEPIADLAAKVGFIDYKNLARQFKEWRGCTPVEFRKKNKRTEHREQPL